MKHFIQGRCVELMTCPAHQGMHRICIRPAYRRLSCMDGVQGKRFHAGENYETLARRFHGIVS